MSQNTITLTDSTFDEIVLKSAKPVLVDFWAVWCGPCIQVGPIVEQIADEFKDKAIIGKIDVDTNPEVSKKYSIRSIPTILFFKNGKEVDKQIGAVAKSVLVSKLQEHF